MIKTAPILLDWKLFCTKCREGEDKYFPASTRRQLNRFYARYRLAAHFESVQAHGYSERALRGYSAGLRLLAAYSAAELLGEALALKVTTWEIHDSALAAALRNVLRRPFEGSDGLFDQKGLRDNLQRFMNGDIDDVRIPATALRVMVAHGSGACQDSCRLNHAAAA
ncbi:MAG: hypothetical protein DDT27_00525 [Dehalococcoidia bacterium]|nr:hypothetical protein [Chloroflexota bacterium]MBT9161982.1 hypothetical protein [Chloroflexota bacterium]